MEALKAFPSTAELLLKIATPYERVKTRFKELPRPPSSITISSPSSNPKSSDRLSTVTTSTAVTEPSPVTATAALSAAQIPKVFSVQNFFVSPGMPIDEKIQEVWTRQILSRLSAVLWHNIPTGTCVQEFMMVGKRPAALKPTVIITCGDRVTKRRVEKEVKRQDWLQELLKTSQINFVALIAKTPLSAGTVSDNDCLETLNGSYAVQLPSPEITTSCGLELLIHGVDNLLRQRCTLGGLLVVKGRVLGLTAGHPFSRVKENSLSQLLSEATEDMNDSNDEESSSVFSESFVFDGDSDDDESDNPVSSDVALFEHTNTLPVSIDAFARDRHRDSRSFFSAEWSLPQPAIVPLLAPKNNSSIEGSLSGSDWALLESLPSAVIMRPNVILDADQTTFTPIEGIVSGLAYGRVVVNAPDVGLQHGYLHYSPAKMQVDRSVLDVQLVILEVIIRKCHHPREYV